MASCAPCVAVLLLVGLFLGLLAPAEFTGTDCLKTEAKCSLYNDKCCDKTICSMSTKCTHVPGPGGCIPTCVKEVDTSLKKVKIVAGLDGWLGGKSSSPGILVMQEMWGIGEAIKETAAQIVQQGYRVLIPDIYRGEVTENFTHAYQLNTDLNWTQANIDMQQAVAYLYKTGSKRVGAVGFCQGGGAVMCAAQKTNVSVTVAFYGATPPNSGCDPTTIKTPIQYHYGSWDALAPLFNATYDAMKAAGVPVTRYYYKGAPHAFMNFLTPYARKWATDKGLPLAPESAVTLAFSRMTDFLAKYLS